MSSRPAKTERRGRVPRAFGKSLMGITRIDNLASNSYGWKVTVWRRGKAHQQFFADFKHGGRVKALEKAQNHRDRILETLPLVTRHEYTSILRTNNKSGTPGVCRIIQKKVVGKTVEEVAYWLAFWPTTARKSKRKKYSVEKYGEEAAYLLACEARRIACDILKEGNEPRLITHEYADWLAKRTGDKTSDS